jgi:hypothetical protein
MRDLGLKQGQIAHLDQNPANNTETNLAFLCFDHHDQFDSTTRQSKNLTKREVEIYRNELHAHIATLFELPETMTGLYMHYLRIRRRFWRWI